MRIDVFTIFPEYLDGPLDASLLGQARERGLLDVRVHDLRDAHHRPSPHRRRRAVRRRRGHGVMPGAALRRGRGGRAAAAAAACCRPAGRASTRRVAARARRAATASRCSAAATRASTSGCADHLCDGELSVGDYVLAGRRGGGAGRDRGGRPARARRDGQRGVGAPTSRSPTGLLEYPQYTRPAEFRGWAVPEVLRSGDHARIARWRRAQALRRTLERRPDLLDGRGGSPPRSGAARRVPGRARPGLALASRVSRDRPGALAP